tara:strand:- start:141 stop:626 length:486 start_codon:yes stop_codon:yes gene_type:complete
MSEEYSYKNSGKDYKKVLKEQSYSNKTKNFNLPLGIKTPLESGTLNNENLFKMHFNLEDQIEDNFKNLLLTKKGERLNSDFGTNLKEIFSLKSKGNVKSAAMEEIRASVEKFIPLIKLIDFTILEEPKGSDDELIYLLNIKYSIPDINNNKSIIIKLKTSG